ncbi:hypothetical protein Tco_0061118 [Tanacetum coccineum]
MSSFLSLITYLVHLLIDAVTLHAEMLPGLLARVLSGLNEIVSTNDIARRSSTAGGFIGSNFLVQRDEK